MIMEYGYAKVSYPEGLAEFRIHCGGMVFTACPGSCSCWTSQELTNGAVRSASRKVEEQMDVV